jgi:eukaryotic-like serine/threonine-protein kinase
MLQPGKALKQRPQYVIEKVIGEGGFGITYKARHQDLNFPVVIKTPNSRLCRDTNYPKYLEGFRKEGRTLAKISQNHHPNIVRIIDFFEEGDLPCLVMDFVKGENLYHLIQYQGILSEKFAIDYIKQIADALSICHQNGIIHRDAHPGNMILRENSNTVILIDFGLSGNVNSQSINREDLRTIDNLWVKYSNGKFGLSVQKRIYQGLGGTREYNSEIWYEFGEKVGWQKGGWWLYYKDITYIKAPEGLLPDWMLLLNNWSHSKILFSRVETCRLFPVQEKQQQNIPIPQPVNQQVQLKSSCGMDYSKLHDLLKAGKWKEADEETYAVMSEVVSNHDWLRVEDIDNFPCADLRTIDQLWVKYSNGRFGFSVQKRIYQGLGGTREYNQEIWEKFGEKVGWRNGRHWCYYSDITFAPDGNLPMGHNLTWVEIDDLWVCYLVSRLIDCNI